jgi:hypothetical protein
MPNFTIEMLCTRALLDGEPRQWKTSVTIENIERNLAIVKGYDECFKIAVAETTDTFVPVPPEAVQYWQKVRREGNVQFMDIQSMLTQEWGITTGIQQEAEAVPITVPRTNGKVKAPALVRGGAPPDFRTGLRAHLAVLQEQHKSAVAERRDLDAQIKSLNHDIMEISEFLAMRQEEKPRKRKAVIHAA